MNIHGKKVILRAVEERDLSLIRKWSNDPSIQSMLGGWHFPVSEQDQRKWFENLSCNSLNQRFSVEAPEHGLIGTASLGPIDWQNGNAFYGTLIGEMELRGKGYALDAIMALMRFSFEEMGLYRLDSDIIEYNAASMKFTLEKCGLKNEGVKKGWYYRKGRRWDKILVGITKDQYQAHCEKIKYWES